MTPIEKALAYLDTLEANRRAALALSEQKAEEARLIQARQEGFKAATEMLGTAISAGGGGSDAKQPVPRRVRRHIPQLILRELSFSGEAMTATQIAKAIDEAGKSVSVPVIVGSHETKLGFLVTPNRTELSGKS